MYNRCEVLCERCRRFFWYRCWWYVAVEKEETVVVFDMLLHMCSIWACYQNLLSTVRPSRRCSATFSIFWPSNDSLNDKSESWCFCRVVIIIDFVFTGLMSMWLTLHHTEIRSRQSCSVFWICTFFPVVWSVVSFASIWDSAEFDLCRGRSLI